MQQHVVESQRGPGVSAFSNLSAGLCHNASVFQFPGCSHTPAGKGRMRDLRVIVRKSGN